jgi:hypothetical protein
MSEDRRARPDMNRVREALRRHDAPDDDDEAREVEGPGTDAVERAREALEDRPDDAGGSD